MDIDFKTATKLYFPVVDTTTGDFSYDRDISTEELIRLQDEQFRKTNSNVQGFVDGYNMHGVKHELFDPVSNRKIIDCINMIPVVCVITDKIGGVKIPDDWFDEVAAAGRMSIMVVNIIGGSIDYDAEEEIRFWISDSALIIDDRRLDKKTRLNALPSRDMELETVSGRYSLQKCKIVERYKGSGFSYSFAMIVEKITKLR
jgi:hypothetical protein